MTDNNNHGAGLSAGGARSSSGAVSRIRFYFLTGLVVAGPVAVTLWLIWWFVTWVDNLVRPVIPVAYRPETYIPVNIPGLGLIIAFVALTLLGFLTANLVGSRLVDLGESLLNRMPIVRPIYRTTKQIFQTLFSASESSFRRVGLVEFPGAGHVVAGVSHATAEPDHRRAPAAEGARVGVPAVYAKSDDRLFLLRAAPRRDRPRHHRRTGHVAVDLRRHHPAWR